MIRCVIADDHFSIQPRFTGHDKEAAEDDSGNWYLRVKEGQFWNVLKDETNKAIPFTKKDAIAKAYELSRKKNTPLSSLSLTRSWSDNVPVEWVERYKNICEECELPQDRCECPKLHQAGQCLTKVRGGDETED